MYSIQPCVLMTFERILFLFFQTHPNVDKKLFNSTSNIKLKNPEKPFPLHQDVGVLKWRYTTQDESNMPLSSKLEQYFYAPITRHRGEGGAFKFYPCPSICTFCLWLPLEHIFLNLYTRSSTIDRKPDPISFKVLPCFLFWGYACLRLLEVGTSVSNGHIVSFD